MELRLARLAAAPAPVSDPNQPTLPGLEPDVIARVGTYDGNRLEFALKIRRDKPVDAPVFADFDAALGAARTMLGTERREARWGMFNRNPGRVEALALMQAADGVRLVRTDMPVDPFKEPVPGQMFPGQNWWGSAVRIAQREYPAVLAVAGAEHVLDLRSSGVVERVTYDV
ncbi:MAG: hypothetical protein JWM86_1808 [Thermoleophilia bacterium]|nr:hypothetical protein [Thermoleophilia bacterium]